MFYRVDLAVRNVVFTKLEMLKLLLGRVEFMAMRETILVLYKTILEVLARSLYPTNVRK